MAVENKYVNSDLAAGKVGKAAYVSGAEAYIAVAHATVAAADDNGSIYRLFKALAPDLIPVKIEILNDAITGGTDYDLGFYEPLEGGSGPVIDKDALVDGADLSSGNGQGSELTGLSAVGVEESQQRLWELAGHTATQKQDAYDIALTANTVGTAAGDIVVKAWFVQG